MSIANKIIEFAEDQTKKLSQEKAIETLLEVIDNLQILVDALESELED